MIQKENSIVKKRGGGNVKRKRERERERGK